MTGKGKEAQEGQAAAVKRPAASKTTTNMKPRPLQHEAETEDQQEGRDADQRMQKGEEATAARPDAGGKTRTTKQEYPLDI